ncbi:MAG: hypothetical protein LIO51_04180 [Clostridiales bacterium]|nr:hypothetical protein [Clostridiales bacterium]
MNALGTHDTLRILTYLGVGSQRYEWSKETRSTYVMTGQERTQGWQRLRLGLAVLFAFPGAPTVYYGDEAGMTGFEDPFNRRPYPWDNEDEEVLACYRELGSLRKQNECLRSGGIVWGDCPGQALSFARTLEDEAIALAVNAGDTETEISVPWDFPSAEDLDSGETVPAENGRLTASVPPMGRRLLRFRGQGE